MNTSDNDDNDVMKVWKPSLDVEFDHEVLVTLWDQDSRTGYNKADFLMNVEYRADYFTDSCDMPNHSGAHYVIDATKVQ